MARILYGIHGTGHGHAMRGLTLARRLRHHEFLFVCGDDAVDVLAPEFPVHRIPNLGTVFRNYRVDFRATVARALPLLRNRAKYIREVTDLISAFGPDVCMTDLEYFVPRAAERAGLPCLSLGHQHVITCCSHHLPGNMWWDTLVQGLTPKYLFRPTDFNLIVSFYQPPVLKKYRARVVPPILRDNVLAAKPEDAGHVLVYQSNSTSPQLVDFLHRATNRTCYVFGYTKTEGREGNVVFMQRSEEVFLKLLASCSYVIQGGSHTLMTEALYLGKPVFSLPLLAMIEQRFNALYLERLGYGMQARMDGLEPSMLTEFESRLPLFRENIARGNFCGNDLVFGLVDTFARTGSMPLEGDARVVEEPEKAPETVSIGSPEETLARWYAEENRQTEEKAAKKSGRRSGREAGRA